MTSPISYCIRCGTPLEDRSVFNKVRRACPACDYIHFPDPKVAAAAFVHEGERVLLVRRAVTPERGKWALPAGYVDAGEDPRAAAIRETLEETGLQIEIVRLLDVLYNRPNSGPDGASIVIVYEGRVIGGALYAHDDADEACWFAADALPELAFASTRLVLDAWRTRGF
jgi:ADP-ribose pyrophosphatase YjhB (NUDIX family)